MAGERRLEGKHIVLGITGGIAAYKAAQLTSLLLKDGAEVRVVMTKNACEFIQPLTFETYTNNRVYVDSFDRKFEIEHVALAKWADLFLVAPATANCMAKLACGIGDDLLSTTALAMTCPTLIAPAMNTGMWKNPATQANLRTLEQRGVHFCGPESGRLACGDDDVGRMSEPAKILEAARTVLCPARDLEGLRVLVTAGPTVERIDPVRYITNRSSGKMGYAIAEAARDRGADVVLVSGPVQLGAPAGLSLVSVTNSAELCAAVLANGPEMDVVIQAAAPADFTPAAVSDKKIKKDGEGLTLELVPTTDIARTLGERKRPGQTFVIFAAETNDVEDNARGKLAKKNADLVVANDVTREGAGFGVDTNCVTLISRQDRRELPLMSKRAVGDAILDRVLELRGKR